MSKKAASISERNGRRKEGLGWVGGNAVTVRAGTARWRGTWLP